MEKLTQEEINKNAYAELDNLLCTKDIERLLQSIKVATFRKLIGEAFTYGDKEYAVYGIGDHKGAIIRVCCSDGRALDLNVESFYYRNVCIDDDLAGEWGVDYEYTLNLPNNTKLTHKSLDGVEVKSPKEYIFKLLGPKGKETTLNGFLFPAGTTLTPSGILNEEILVNITADSIIDEPMPRSNGFSTVEPIVSLNLRDLSRIKTSDSKKTEETQNEIIKRLTRVLEEEVKKRAEERRETVGYRLDEVKNMIKNKEALIEQIRSCTFTSEELRMAINCLEGRNIREGIETR